MTEFTVFRAVAKVRKRDLWVVAEDWPTQADATRAARLAAKWMGAHRKALGTDWRPEIAIALGVNLERPYGCDLRLSKVDPIND